MKRNEQELDVDAILDEVDNIMVGLLESIFGVKFEVVSEKPKKMDNKSDFEDWEVGTFKTAEVFRA